MVAIFAFILTNGTSGSSTTDDSARTGAPAQSSTPSTRPKANPGPSTATGKADRKPPVSQKTTATKPSKSATTPNTGSQSPTFHRGQWIALVDSFPSDAGLPADQLAKSMAAKMIAAGVPAKALLAAGQYPGLANSNFEPIRDTWIVYLGPVSSAEVATKLCASPKTQQAHGGFLACPTFEPATAHN